MKLEKLLIALWTSLALALGFLAGRQMPKEGQEEPIKERVDTLYVRDTITLTEPVSVARYVIDSVLVPVTDTLRMRDTLFISLEREGIVWQDSLSVVYASGINPQVDSVRHFVENMTITRFVPYEVKVKSRWGLGVTAGYGAGKEGLSPYVGVGLTYNILSW